ncbi:MAG: adenine deaminase, partial [Candidatus Aminicenantes bacterium]|nr:adenine deaminase [Candidatus Aminicenantes bacterium]
NPSNYFSKFYRFHGFPQTGEIAEGKKANLIVFQSLDTLEIDKVIHNGELVVTQNKYTGKHPDFDYSEFFGQVVTGKTFQPEDFKIKPAKSQTSVNVKVIEIIKDSLETGQKIVPFSVVNGEIKTDPEKDLAKIAVIERHRGTGSYSLGFVQGLGLKKGAIASTVAHDSHNLIVAGADDEAMARAVHLLSEKGGGMVVITEKADYFPLKIAGLMSTSKIEKVIDDYHNIKQAVKSTCSPLDNAFMALSFLALPVIPRLKITNRGLVDVEKFQFVDLY